ncbi:MAG TPA: FAD-linked oxidase C-terminal domain-containing protein [bacterium]|nr:FAD-linked oxidase C-terminal domain-containing protein [bacterium]
MSVEALADARIRIPSRARLAHEMAEIVGDAYVLERPGDVLAYEYDASNITAVPDLVVLPGSAAEVSRVLRVAARRGIPIVPRGAGTGVAGGALPIVGGVVVALTRMNRILEVDPESRVAVVEPGVTNIEITRAVAAHGLFYAPDPSSQYASSIGGNVGHNSGGPHTIAYGVTTNHVLGLEIAQPNGDLTRVGAAGPDAPGVDLPGLIVGGEGTLGIVTRIWIRLLRAREAVATLLAIFADLDRASEAVTEIIGCGVAPVALEMLDRNTIRVVEPFVHAGYPLDAEAVLLIEVEGVRDVLPSASARVAEICRGRGAVEVRTAHSEEERQALWLGRKAAFGTLGRIAVNYYLHDAVVPRTRLPGVLRRVQQIAAREGLTLANVFHAGDGNLHPIIIFDAQVPGETERVIRAGEEMLRACVEAGGTITGEHGVGFEKNNYMPWIYSEVDLRALRVVKDVFDPAGLMNPWKLFPTPVSCAQVLAHSRPAPPRASTRV